MINLTSKAASRSIWGHGSAPPWRLNYVMKVGGYMRLRIEIEDDSMDTSCTAK